MYNKQNLTRIKKMNSLAPEVMTAFWAFDRASIADGAIPVKYKELIAVAVALTTQFCGTTFLPVPQTHAKANLIRLER